MRKGHPQEKPGFVRTADDYLQIYSFIFGLCADSFWNELAGSCSKVEILV